ncbi:MAG: DinB family protein [Planctomycetota bacterium]
MATNTEALSPTSLGLEAMERSRAWLNGLLDTLTPEQFFARPEGTRTHAMYVIGHLAFADQGFLGYLGVDDRIVPDAWTESFNFKKETVSDSPNDFPPVEEVREVAQKVRDRLLEHFRSLTPEQLAAPFDADFQMFASCPAALMSSIAYHEGFHSGQIATIRQALGLAPVMM